MTTPRYPEQDIGEALRGGPPVRLLDLSGRERQLRWALLAMERIGQSFARYARRSKPFLARQHARIVTSSVRLTPPGQGEPMDAPTFVVAVGSSEALAWGSITLNAAAVAIAIEGALGGSVMGTAAAQTAEPTPAQRALLARVGRSLATDLCTSIKEEVGLTWRPLASDPTSQAPTSESDALEIVCVIEGVQLAAKLSIVASAEALEAAAREQSTEGDSVQGDPRLVESLREVPIEVVAELGRVQMGLRGVLSLRPGDLVKLKTAVDDTVRVCVGGVGKFEGLPVLSRGQFAVEVRSRITG